MIDGGYVRRVNLHATNAVTLAACGHHRGNLSITAPASSNSTTEDAGYFVSALVLGLTNGDAAKL